MKIKRAAPPPPEPTLEPPPPPAAPEQVTFTVLDINAVPNVTGNPASVSQVCSKGHRWDLRMNLVGIRLNLTSLGITEGVEDYCLFCLRDLLRQHVGRVKTA